jgi:hypothetical protein
MLWLAALGVIVTAGFWVAWARWTEMRVRQLEQRVADVSRLLGFRPLPTDDSTKRNILDPIAYASPDELTGEANTHRAHTRRMREPRNIFTDGS